MHFLKLFIRHASCRWGNERITEQLFLTRAFVCFEAMPQYQERGYHWYPGLLKWTNLDSHAGVYTAVPFQTVYFSLVKLGIHCTGNRAVFTQLYVECACWHLLQLLKSCKTYRCGYVGLFLSCLSSFLFISGSLAPFPQEVTWSSIRHTEKPGRTAGKRLDLECLCA